MPRTRRYPNFGAFIGTGIVLGFVLGSILATLGGEEAGYSTTTAVLFLGTAGACVLGLLAALLAVLLDRRG